MKKHFLSISKGFGNCLRPEEGPLINTNIETSLAK